MPLLLRLLLTVLIAFAAGTIFAPLIWLMFSEAKQILSPFLLISIAILIASVGYACGSFRR
jgi:hypothetical protein